MYIVFIVYSVSVVKSLHSAVNVSLLSSAEMEEMCILQGFDQNPENIICCFQLVIHFRLEYIV